MTMGEFSSKLMAELARDSGKNLDTATKGYQISQKETLGAFSDPTQVPEGATALDQQFKDALFTLVLLRARNYMIKYDVDSRDKNYQEATVSIDLVFVPEDIVHNTDLVDGMPPHKYVYEEESKRGKGIIFKVKADKALDEMRENENFNIIDFVKEFSTTYKLSCRINS